MLNEMENKKIFSPKGVYPALATPFTDDGKVNEEELKKLVNWLIEAGVNGIFPLGSIGEGIHLSFEEKVRVIEVILEAVDGRVPVIPGTTDTCAKNTINLSRRAQELGCSGVVIATPYYLPITQDSIERHYEEVAIALPNLPIILYNIPAFSTPISYDVVASLSKYPNIVAMKESSGNMVDLLHFMDVSKKNGELDILTGREETLFAALMMGAKGTLSGAVGIIPEVMVSVYQAWKDGDYDKAREAQTSMLELVRVMNTVPFPLGFKEALNIRGFKMGKPVKPISKREEEAYVEVSKNIENVLKKLLGDELKVV